MNQQIEDVNKFWGDILTLIYYSPVNMDEVRGDKDVDFRKKGYYNYIPTDTRRIKQLLIDYILPIPNKKELRFLDAGAGTVLIPRIVKAIGFKEAKGLEYNTFLVDKSYGELIQGDILSYDFSGWDVIYSYNPLSSQEMMVQGLLNIMDTMSKGSTFIFYSASSAMEDTRIRKKYGKKLNYKQGIYLFKK